MDWRLLAGKNMAQRRMFSPDIVASDAFLDMPTSSRELYFQLGMYADDDGFVSPRKIMRLVGASDDDLKVLLTKRFVLSFQSGVIVIKHWLIHNLIRKDRYKETRYVEEKKLLQVKENGAYTELGKPNGNQMAPQVRLGKVRLGKDNTLPAKPENSGFKKVIEQYYELKGWPLVGNPKLFARYLRPAKELFELCEGDLKETKECLEKVSVWAKSKDLDWSIETVFKRWYDIDELKPKEKKPYIDGKRAFQKVEGGKWYIVTPDGVKEYGVAPSEIIYK